MTATAVNQDIAPVEQTEKIQRIEAPTGFNALPESIRNAFFHVQQMRAEQKDSYQNGVFSFPLLDYDLAKNAFWEVCKIHVKERQRNFSNGFFVSESLKMILPNLIKWLIYDSESSYSLQKGFYFWGDTGTGKSELIKIMRKFCMMLGIKERQFSCTSVPEIATYVNLDNGLLRDIYFFEENNCYFDDFLFNLDKTVIERSIIETRKESEKITMLTTRHSPNVTIAFLESEDKEFLTDMFNIVLLV